MHRLTLSAAMILANAASPLNAALVITQGDIDAANSRYVYNLTFAEMADGATFTADVFEQTNVEVRSEGTGTAERRFIAAKAGERSASLVYRFDFSGTSYRPTQVVLDNPLFLFDRDAVPQDVVATIAWSIDNVNYTTFRTVSSATTTTNQGSTYQHTIPLPSGPAAFYYRVSFEAAANGPAFGTNMNQWNRLSPTATAPFTANFTVTEIPEPTSAGLLALGGMAVLYRTRVAH